MQRPMPRLTYQFAPDPAQSDASTYKTAFEFPNTTEINSQGSYGGTPNGISPGRVLPRLLRVALQTCKSNGDVQSFLPDDKLAEIMTTENVRYYLSNSGSTFHEYHETIMEHVCGQTGRSHARRASRRIFAILLLIDEPHLMKDFIEQGIDDDDLPLSILRMGYDSMDQDVDDYLARSTSDGPIIIDKFCQWTYAQRQTFYNNQWRVQVPTFRKGRRMPDSHPVHKFGKDVILPWTEYEEHYNGLSEVSRVRIHNAHCQLRVGDDQSFALKSLKSVVPQYGEQEFRLEVKAILKVKPRPHLEVGLLTSFKHRERFHLLFRWAEGGNLRDLWTKHPRPDLNHPRICWIAQQLHGLAYGVDGIHNTKMTASEAEAVQISPLSPDAAQQSFDITYDPVHEDDEGKDYGRHGDIKPENILWFKQDTSHPEFGILKLSDFGLTTFHRALTTAVKAEDIKVTNTYSAPEREIEQTLSRPFDVWSLGCIYLEFVTWILLGVNGLTFFEDERVRDGGNRSPKFSVDNFYAVFLDGEVKYRARVKPSVTNWIIRLQRKPLCSQFLSELLDYVQHKMLLVRKEDRDSSEAVSLRLKEMLDRCKRDEDYALRGRLKRDKRKRLEFQAGQEDKEGPASRTRSRLQ